MMIDHAVDIVTRNAKRSALGEMKVHCTKCGKLITTGITPSMKNTLLRNVTAKKYSLPVMKSWTY